MPIRAVLVRAAMASVAAAAVLSAPSVAAPVSLPRAPDTVLGTPYLVRHGHAWTVHDGAASIALPDSIVDNGREMPPQYGVFRLLGRVGADYVLVETVGPTAYDGGLTELDLHLLRPDGTAETFYAEDGRAIGQQARLSDDGRAVWILHDDSRAGMDQSVLVSLDGTVTALPDRRRRVLEVSTATSVLFARTGRRPGLYRTDVARGRTTLVSPGPGARLADLAADVLVRRADGISRVARLSRPARVRWTSPLVPLATDGRLVLLAGPTGAAVEVRRIGDGRLVADLAADRSAGRDGIEPTQAWWDDADHVLLSDGSRLVRCGVDGDCVTLVDVSGQGAASVTLPGAIDSRAPDTRG